NESNEGELSIDRYQQEQALAAHRVAMILGTGLGFMSYTQGDLRSAQLFVHSARILIASSNDWVHKAYIELLCGCLTRATAGLNKSDLNHAIEPLSKAFDVFNNQNHIYRARAAYELALAYTYLEEFKQARGCIKTALDVAESGGDDRWRSNA